MHKVETICALATAIGQSGIGVVRVSGPLSKVIANKVLNVELEPRVAYYGSFYDEESNQVDKGVAIFFPGPHSYTGEDVVEISSHGNPAIVDAFVGAVCECGGRIAEPGEFTRRAFINGKMDLVQAEAVAVVIYTVDGELEVLLVEVAMVLEVIGFKVVVVWHMHFMVV